MGLVFAATRDHWFARGSLAVRDAALLLAAGGVWLGLAGPAAAAPGQTGYDGCLASAAADGCGDLPGNPLTGARAVAVSPDGKSVYVASETSASIAHFFRSG